jgi:DNA-directed RNA polymerase subunit RPC12/RpoP
MAKYKCSKCGQIIEITPKTTGFGVCKEKVGKVLKDKCFICGTIINKKRDKIL